jgi:hypothetical protein
MRWLGGGYVSEDQAAGIRLPISGIESLQGKTTKVTTTLDVQLGG